MTVKVEKDVKPDLVRCWATGLPGCVVEARDEQEAYRKIMEAVKGYFASLDCSVREIVIVM